MQMYCRDLHIARDVINTNPKAGAVYVLACAGCMQSGCKINILHMYIDIVCNYAIGQNIASLHSCGGSRECELSSAAEAIWGWL